MNLQQRHLLDFVTEEIDRRCLEIGPELSLDKYLVNKIRRISDGEFLVLEVEDGKVQGIGKITQFSDASSVSDHSILYSYHQLESAFYERYQIQGQL